MSTLSTFGIFSKIVDIVNIVNIVNFINRINIVNWQQCQHGQLLTESTLLIVNNVSSVNLLTLSTKYLWDPWVSWDPRVVFEISFVKSVNIVKVSKIAKIVLPSHRFYSIFWHILPSKPSLKNQDYKISKAPSQRDQSWNKFQQFWRTSWYFWMPEVGYFLQKYLTSCVEKRLLRWMSQRKL